MTTTPKSQYIVRPRSEMPPPVKHRSARRGLTEAIRNLQPSEALFVPLPERAKNLDQFLHNVRANLYSAKDIPQVWLRLDREANGIWIALRDEQS